MLRIERVKQQPIPRNLLQTNTSVGYKVVGKQTDLFTIK